MEGKALRAISITASYFGAKKEEKRRMGRKTVAKFGELIKYSFTGQVERLFSSQVEV